MKHLEVRQNTLLDVVFSSLFSVLHPGDETLRLMLDMLPQKFVL